MTEHYDIYGCALSLLPDYVRDALCSFCEDRGIDPFSISQVMRNVDGWTVVHAGQRELFVSAADARPYGR